MGGIGASGKQFVKCTYRAFMNMGEQINVRLADPFFSMVNDSIVGQGYYGQSRQKGPINIRSRIEWVGGPSNLVTEYQNHALIAINPVGKDAESQEIEFIAIDFASWFLNGGDAGGYSYQGSVSEVIEQVCRKYGHGILRAEVATKTKDSKHNRWWQNRMTPRAFIKSLLEWAPAVSDKKTTWLVWPDDGGGESSVQHRVKFVEMGQEQSLQRATYNFRGAAPGEKGYGDIIDWELLGDNSLAIVANKMVTSGISSVSGTYYDRRTPDDGDKVKIGDKETPNKLKPKVQPTGAYSKPPDSDPLTGPTGWTAIPALPEPSGGELGLKFDEYMIGPALNRYLSASRTLLNVRFRVTGHHIWSGSFGLGVDTIEIKMSTEKGNPHFLKGKWIVFGYQHTLTRKEWVTDLYCYRLDHDAQARTV